MINNEILQVLSRIDGLTSRMIDAPAEQLPDLMQARQDAIMDLDCLTCEELPKDVLSTLFLGLQRVILSTPNIEQKLRKLRSHAISELTSNTQMHEAVTRYSASR